MPCGWGCFFAGPAAAYNAQVLSGARDTAEQLQRAEQPHGDQSSDRHDVGSFRQTADAAFDQLKQISQTENPKLYEVARRMGNRRYATFTRHQPHDPNTVTTDQQHRDAVGFDASWRIEARIASRCSRTVSRRHDTSVRCSPWVSP